MILSIFLGQLNFLILFKKSSLRSFFGGQLKRPATMTILISIGVVLFLLLTIRNWMISSAPHPPANFNETIQAVMTSDLPELMPGKSGFAKNGDIKICYEVLENENCKNVNILLVNGLTQTLLEWQAYFYQPLLDAGYRVIRYDNRGIGQSDWMKNWGKNSKYTLKEMATDGIAVLDHLGIDQAHVIGSSMGGMICQRLAINYPSRILSLTSIMSTGFYFDKKLTDMPKPFLLNLTKLIFRYKKTMDQDKTKMKFQYGIRQILKGKDNYELNPKSNLQQFYYEIKNRNGSNPKATDQHDYAIKKSGSRYEELKNLNLPSLIIHGTDDTLILVNHAEKYGPMIPNSTSLILDGMGHDIPEKYTPEILKSLFVLFEKKNQTKSIS
jgi:pimeloyl-ACP methyl ester carboxylesterase